MAKLFNTPNMSVNQSRMNLTLLSSAFLKMSCLVWVSNCVSCLLRVSYDVPRGRFRSVPLQHNGYDMNARTPWVGPGVQARPSDNVAFLASCTKGAAVGI